MSPIATPAMHRKQETELVRLMEQAQIDTAVRPLIESSKKPKVYRSARPGISGCPLPHHTRGTLVRRRNLRG